MVTKKLAAIIKEEKPDLDNLAKRRQGEVTLSWLALARLVDITPDSYRIEWNLQAAATAGIDKESVAKKLAERDRRTVGDIEWG